MTTLKKGDFIELDYTGTQEDGKVFDTTRKDVAQTAGLNARASFAPVIICLGEGHLLPGLDVQLIGKGLGAHTCTLTAAQAFGAKDPKLLKLIPQAKFTEQKLRPMVGLEVEIDNHYGIIRSVSGGRVTVDFNHPLAGRGVTYAVDVKRLVIDKKEHVEALLAMIGLHHHGVAMEGDGHAVIKTHSALPQQVAESVNAMITKLTGITTISYHVDTKGHETGHAPQQAQDRPAQQTEHQHEHQ